MGSSPIIAATPSFPGETGKRSRLRPCDPQGFVGSTPTGSTTPERRSSVVEPRFHMHVCVGSNPAVVTTVLDPHTAVVTTHVRVAQ